MATLLIIDDNTSVLRTLDYFFSSEGHAVLTAADGQDGLRLAAGHPVDLVLLDVEMAPLSGLAVCKALKADRALGHIPVIMMTGRPTRDLASKATAAGAAAVFGKPFDLDRLRATIDEFVSRTISR
jgi:two-component system phosphate regulon response regulator PhoB